MYLDLAFGRYGHACGVLRDNDGTATHVVVVGGYGVDGLLQETEIFDLNDWNWSKGPPMAIYGAGKKHTLIHLGRIIYCQAFIRLFEE